MNKYTKYTSLNQALIKIQHLKTKYEGSEDQKNKILKIKQIHMDSKS